MSDLVEFLRARLDEDEAVARYCLDQAAILRAMVDGLSITWDWAMQSEREGGGYSSGFMHIEGFDPARVLAEVEAKRRIIDDFEHAYGGSADGLCAAIQFLASVYADHDDYQQEWTPSAG